MFFDKMNKAYYRLSLETDRKKIGHYIQCKGVPTGYTISIYKDATKLSSTEFPTFPPKLIWELEEKAILTDILSPSNINGRGLLVNKSVKEVLEKFNLWKVKFHPADVYVKEKNYEYYWLQVLDSGFEGIDFKDTYYVKTTFRNGLTQNLQIDSVEEYRQEFELCKGPSLMWIGCEKLKLTDAFSHYNIFVKSNVSITALIVNEALKKALSIFTGIRFTPLEKPSYI